MAFLLPWQNREAYFKKHGNNPAVPYIERSECGCHTIWRTPAMGEHYMCDRDIAISKQEMRALQKRRYAAAGLDYPD